MTTITFRSATARDIPALITLINSAYRGGEEPAGWTTEAELIEGIRDGLQFEVLEKPLAVRD